MKYLPGARQVISVVNLWFSWASCKKISQNAFFTSFYLRSHLYLCSPHRWRGWDFYM